MNFTYNDYAALLDLLKECGYTDSDYRNYGKHDKCVILRHDVDQSPEFALRFAEIEAGKEMRGSYFVLLNTDLYNIASKTQRDRILAVHRMGHDIGLHFDETRYDSGDIRENIRHEAEILSDILGLEIDLVSMHRPSKSTLEADIEIPGMVNSYSQLFFKSFKYLSDSRCFWREPVEDIIRAGKYKKLHILTHPFWYSDIGRSAGETIESYVNHANAERYEIMLQNIRDLSALMDRKQVK